jgi:hypothetical protein
VRFTLAGPDDAKLAALPGVTGVEIHGDGVTLHTNDADSTVRTIYRQDLPIRDIEVTGADLIAFFCLAGWSFSNGIVEEHVTYGVVLLALAGMGAGNYYGLDRMLGERFPIWFRNWFMSGDPNPPAVRQAAGTSI